MRLTVYTDYSLRVLMYLALHSERLPTIAEIAATHGISKNHLMTVVYELGLAGFVDTVRGRGGGLRLGRKPEKIGLGDVVRHSEPDMDIVPCFVATATVCALQPACKLRSVLYEAAQAFLDVLDRYTLADLVANKDQLTALLALGAPPRVPTPKTPTSRTGRKAKPATAPPRRRGSTARQAG
jgi:Rrf2 family nitric oxide-sensitive transcriptional repressor